MVGVFSLERVKPGVHCRIRAVDAVVAWGDLHNKALEEEEGGEQSLQKGHELHINNTHICAEKEGTGSWPTPPIPVPACARGTPGCLDRRAANQATLWPATALVQLLISGLCLVLSVLEHVFLTVQNVVVNVQRSSVDLCPGKLLLCPFLLYLVCNALLCPVGDDHQADNLRLR